MSMSHETLARYVLGTLPPEEAEKLDERSVTDAEFAAQLKVVEHDLADAYVRGELSADERQQWERIFLASPEGRDQLRFATALASRQIRRAVATKPRLSRWMIWLAVAEVAAIVTILVLTTTPRPIEQPTIANKVSPAAPPAPDVPPAPAPSGRQGVVALTLTPVTRSVTSVPRLQLSPQLAEVRLTLRLDPNDFQQFRVDIRTAAGDTVVWRSGVLQAAADTTGVRSVTVSVPAEQLQAGRFTVFVTGLSSRGDDIVGTYSVDVE